MGMVSRVEAMWSSVAAQQLVGGHYCMGAPHNCGSEPDGVTLTPAGTPLPHVMPLVTLDCGGSAVTGRGSTAKTASSDSSPLPQDSGSECGVASKFGGGLSAVSRLARCRLLYL